MLNTAGIRKSCKRSSKLNPRNCAGCGDRRFGSGAQSDSCAVEFERGGVFREAGWCMGGGQTARPRQTCRGKLARLYNFGAPTVRRAGCPMGPRHLMSGCSLSGCAACGDRRSACGGIEWKKLFAFADVVCNSPSCRLRLSSRSQNPPSRRRYGATREVEVSQSNGRCCVLPGLFDIARHLMSGVVGVKFSVSG
jgi:hypothetical protein